MGPIKMEALQTFSGREGLIKRGEPFEVTDKQRAKNLEKKKLAKYAGGKEQDGNQEPANDKEPEGQLELTEEEAEELTGLIDGYKTHKELNDYADRIEIPAEIFPANGKVDEKKAAIFDYLGVEPGKE